MTDIAEIPKEDSGTSSMDLNTDTKEEVDSGSVNTSTPVAMLFGDSVGTRSTHETITSKKRTASTSPGTDYSAALRSGQRKFAKDEHGEDDETFVKEVMGGNGVVFIDGDSGGGKCKQR